MCAFFHRCTTVHEIVFLTFDRLTKKNENESAICEFKNYFSCAIKWDGNFFCYDSGRLKLFALFCCGIVEFQCSTYKKCRYAILKILWRKKFSVGFFCKLSLFYLVYVEIRFYWKQKKKLTTNFHVVQLVAIITVKRTYLLNIKWWWI